MYTHTKQVFQSGQPLRAAETAIIMLHGRGANAGGISHLAHELDLKQPAVLAPVATQSSWYPYSFLAPVADNQPALNSALHLISEIVQDILFAGLPLWFGAPMWVIVGALALMLACGALVVVRRASR